MIRDEDQSLIGTATILPGAPDYAEESELTPAQIERAKRNNYYDQLDTAFAKCDFDFISQPLPVSSFYQVYLGDTLAATLSHSELVELEFVVELIAE